MDLTKEAAEGYDWMRENGACYATPGDLLRNPSAGKELVAACPYLNTSPSAMAWHAGRWLAVHAYGRPADLPLPDRNRVAVNTSRGITINVRGYKQTLLVRLAWRTDNTFVESHT